MAGSHHRFRSLLIIAAVTALLGCDTTVAPTARQKPPDTPQGKSTRFEMLPLRGSGDFVKYVGSLAHDPAYKPLDSLRESQVGAMFDAIMTARQLPPGWCMAVTAAGKAGYRLGRYYDVASQRWFIVGADRSGTGQAYFFINPKPRRYLVIEAPHVFASDAKLEGRTDTEGAHLLLETLGWALLINGADRCQGLDNNCGGTFSSDSKSCPGKTKYCESDSAHNTDSAFHVLHKRFNDVSAKTRFVQLHGNTEPVLYPGGISVSDGRSDKKSGLATVFVNVIDPLLTSPVNDCSSINGKDIVCGYRNVQGRYTNKPDEPNCEGYEMTEGGTRFLHLEQRSGSPPTKSLIDDWQPVSVALQAIFPCPGCSIPPQVFVPEQPDVCAEIP